MSYDYELDEMNLDVFAEDEEETGDEPDEVEEEGEGEEEDEVEEDVEEE